MSFNNLPSELLAKITSFNGLQNTLEVSLVNKETNNYFVNEEVFEEMSKIEKLTKQVDSLQLVMHNLFKIRRDGVSKKSLIIVFSEVIQFGLTGLIYSHSVDDLTHLLTNIEQIFIDDNVEVLDEIADMIGDMYLEIRPLCISKMKELKQLH
jgi:hypothetical protein